MNGKKMTIKYGTEPPAKLMPYLVYESVRTRFKNDTRKKNTNATKATKFGSTHEHKVPTYLNSQNKQANMINTNKPYKIPEHNVVLMWFEKKKEGK